MWVRYAAVAAYVVAALVALVWATRADAATYLTECATAPPPSPPGEITDDAIETRNQRIEDAQNCAAIVERLETLVALIEAQEETGGTTAQRVSLVPQDRNRLDLMWWGAWAGVGMLLTLLVAPMMQRAFRWWRE